MEVTIHVKNLPEWKKVSGLGAVYSCVQCYLQKFEQFEADFVHKTPVHKTH